MMKIAKTLQFGLVWMACVGMCWPSIALAGNPSPPISSLDVALQSGGQLTGRIVDATGTQLVGETLAVFSAGREVARVLTDENGRFVVRNLHGGVHQIMSRKSATVVRLWPTGTAPPAATQDVLLVAGGVVRGQCPECGQPDCQASGDAGVSDDTVYYDDETRYGDACDSGCYGYDSCDQAGRHGLWSRPLLIGGIIATAIAIPVALADDDDRDDAS